MYFQKKKQNATHQPTKKKSSISASAKEYILRFFCPSQIGNLTLTLVCVVRLFPELTYLVLYSNNTRGKIEAIIII